MLYSFTDVNELRQDNILPAEALSINGIYIENEIEGYRTLHVSGREAMSKTLTEISSSRADGARFLRKHLPPRTITVTYQLIAKTPQAFREKYNRLNQLLDEEEAELIFADEPDKFFIGTCDDMESPEPGSNSVVSTFELYCSDPLKYSVEEYVVESTIAGADTNEIEIDYHGTYRSYPRIEMASHGANGMISIAKTHRKNNGAISFASLHFGNSDETDINNYQVIENLIGTDKQTDFGADELLTGWELNQAPQIIAPGVVSTYDARNLNGTVRMYWDESEKCYYMGLDSSGTTLANAWRGATIRKRIPKNSEGGIEKLYVFFRAVLEISKQAEVGVSNLLVTDEDGKVLFGIVFDKNNIRSTCVTKMYCGEQYDKDAIDSYVNDLQYDHNRLFLRTGWHDMDYDGQGVGYTISGKMQKYTGQLIEAMKDRDAAYIVLAMLKHKDYSRPSKIGFRCLLVQDRNVGKSEDVANTFDTDVILMADCKSAEVRTRHAGTNDQGTLSPSLGAIGNAWEDFYFLNGKNYININQSSWVTPDTTSDVKVTYREAYL